jgi:cobyrinic acid a,c-diamide synthase
MATRLPARLVVAGLSGDAGKTLIAAGLVRALAKRGLHVAPFKKGPDYIDAAWLGTAAGKPARNLDTFMIPSHAVIASLASTPCDVAVVEGNRGLFDGFDARGTHSTAQLAKLISAPVVLIVDATKTTATVAAQVLGCQAMDPSLKLAGVVLNRVGTARQESIVREAVVNATGLPVLGAVPRLAEIDLPSRHLGLVTVAEHPRADAMAERAGELVEKYLDVGAFLYLARRAEVVECVLEERPDVGGAPRARIALARDAAFSFYYPENLQALEDAGAELVECSPLADEELPDVDGLLLGGGFPEVHAERLAANSSFRTALASRVAAGLPVWAECGGLMYLAERLVVDGTAYPMVGALPVTIEQTARPQGHGYVSAHVDVPNPFLPEGTSVHGHEFHYSRVVDGFAGVRTVLALERGVGLGERRDGIWAGRIVASYTHLHALGVPEWASSVVTVACGGRQ